PFEINEQSPKFGLSYKKEALAEVKKCTYQNRPSVLNARQARSTEKIYLSGLGEKPFWSSGPEF
ncbi:MAG: hypothetical protein PHV51_04475, partial [Methanosarcinaceae archaeon]|nr:hypothetical protein [Methanosarcinaceae archaeon]